MRTGRRRSLARTAAALVDITHLPALRSSPRSLSDDDPAGITTYSILGADYGYRLLWVLTLSTVALIVFHDLAARMGVITGKGLMRLVRER